MNATLKRSDPGMLSPRVVAFLGCALAAVACAQPAGAVDVKVKMNWDVGTADIGGLHWTLTYKDAHIKIATKGFIEETPAPTTVDDGFDNSMKGITHGLPDDCLTIDWTDAAGLTGTHHIGAEFVVDNLGMATDIRVKDARLTMVSGTSGTNSFSGVASLDVPGPPSFSYMRVKSADVIFSNDFAPGTPALMYSGVTIYKTATEPSILDLDAADFPALPKTFLMAVPDFVLAPGAALAVPTVAGIDAPEWLVISVTTSWTDPLLTTLVGAPATVSVNTWFAGEMVVPEPGSLALAIAAGATALAVGVLRRPRRAP